MQRRRRCGFTLVEVLVVIGIIGVLLGILLPVAEKVRHRAYISSCASNLQQIGQALLLYANDNNKSYPRTNYDPTKPTTAGADISTTNLFAPARAVNDVTAAIFLLMRTSELPSKVFICPYNDVNVFTADTTDPSVQGNFTNYSNNLGYSFANMYPSESAAQQGYKWGSTMPAGFAVAADLNPGLRPPQHDPSAVLPDSSTAVYEAGNSDNHEQEGQNILYGDGHVSFELTCLHGLRGDNIYLNKHGKLDESPIDASDSVLLPFEK